MPKKSLTVQVQPDHLAKLAQCKPVQALAELIWNALDADAHRVDVTLDRVEVLNTIRTIMVKDDGHGLTSGEADEAFQNLGGSWKRHKRRTRQHRMMHGQAGEGRFRAFALGTNVSWTSRALSDGKIAQITISGERNSRNFDKVEDTELGEKIPGTSVTILNASSAAQELNKSDTAMRLAQEFALYLRNYKGVEITFDGQPVDPSKVELRTTVIDLDGVEIPGESPATGTLTVIEWTREMPRALVLCDSSGFALSEREPGIKAPGYQFTAYLQSDHLERLREKGLLAMQDLAPGVAALIEQSKGKLRDHFRARALEDAQHAVDRWRTEEVYPFEGSPDGPIEQVERQVFDIVALNMADHLPGFEKSDKKQKKLAFKLVRQAIEMNPGALQTILVEVLGLPKEKQEELADLLKRTTLSSIISASKLVTDRLEFLAGLDQLLFKPESKQRLLERTQLHRILAKNTWLFGEEYHITVDDESLNTVLEKHRAILGREPADDAPVVREDGGTGIVDLMLSRTIKHPNTLSHEHLVVELKRPSKKIDGPVLDQITSYAIAVARDERFRDTKTRWRFITVSNDMNEVARRRASQKEKDRGLVHEDDQYPITVWAFTWAQIIDAARERLEFFKDALNVQVSQATAQEHLVEVYGTYLPQEAAAAAIPKDTSTSAPMPSSRRRTSRARRT